MRTAKLARLFVSSFAVVSVVGVMAVVACGPSAPASQSGSGDKESPTATPVPTATPYPDDCVEVHHPTEEGMMTICPEPGPRQIQQELRKQYNRHMADKAAAAQDGRRAAVDPVMVDVLIHTSTEYAVDDVVGFLQRNGVARVHSTKGGVHSAGRVNAIVNIELLPSIIEIVGVQAVVKVPQAQPAGGNLQATPTLTRDMRGHYNYAMQQNAARGVSGDAREFPELDLFITTRTADAVDEVAEFLRSNGVGLRYTALYKEPDGSRGSVKARVNLSLLPQLVAIESVKWVHEDLDRKYLDWGTGGFDWSSVDDDLWTLYESTKRENNARRTRGEEALPDPVVRVRIKIDSSSAVDGVLRHLRSNGGENVVWKKVERSTGDQNGSGTVEADVDIWVVAGMRWLHGVREIKEIQESSKVPAGWQSGFGGSAGRDVVEPPSGPTASVVAAQADQWHRAGYTGAGVGVAVIDVGFLGEIAS